MYQVGEYVVYKRDVCQIKQILENHFANKNYYRMCPINDSSLTIDIPSDNISNLVRPVISKKEVEVLISKIPDIEIIDVEEKMLENEYRSLMKTNKQEDLIKIIKTTYLRNNARIKSGKKLTERDDTYFKNAEKLLYNELSISLGKSYEETKQYIIDKVTALTK